MIQVIYGPRGAGKTKRILNMAKDELVKSRGHVVFIEKDNRSMLSLPHAIRYVNAAEYGVREADKLYGFISGMLAADFDIVSIFLDAMPSIAGLDSALEAEELFTKLAGVMEERGVDLTVSMSAVEGDVPEYLSSYII